MKILVTGGNGFIGSNFINWLLKNQPDNRILNLNRSLCPNNYIQPITSITGDLRYLHQIENIVNDFKPDQVYHFAANPNPKIREDINAHFTENVFTTNNLFYACRELKPKIFLASSIVVHPDYSNLVVTPKSIYGVSKVTCEFLASIYNTNFEIPVIIGRFGASLGSGLKRGLIWDIVKKLRSNDEKLHLIGTSPGPRKPYTLLSKVMPNIWSTMNRYYINITDYANNDILTVKQVAQICMKKLGITKEIEWHEGERQWGDHDCLLANSNMTGSEEDINSYLESIC